MGLDIGGDCAVAVHRGNVDSNARSYGPTRWAME
jgi:hypothetical protein